jgi:hypothetical protein
VPKHVGQPFSAISPGRAASGTAQNGGARLIDEARLNWHPIAWESRDHLPPGKSAMRRFSATEGSSSPPAVRPFSAQTRTLGTFSYDAPFTLSLKTILVVMSLLMRALVSRKEIVEMQRSVVDDGLSANSSCCRLAAGAPRVRAPSRCA